MALLTSAGLASQDTQHATAPEESRHLILAILKRSGNSKDIEKVELQARPICCTLHICAHA